MEALIFDLKPNQGFKLDKVSTNQVKKKNFAEVLNSVGDDNSKTFKDRIVEKSKENEEKKGINPNLSGDDKNIVNVEDIEKEEMKISTEEEISYEGIFNYLGNLSFTQETSEEQDEFNLTEIGTKVDHIDSTLNSIDDEAEEQVNTFEEIYFEDLDSNGDLNNAVIEKSFMRAEEPLANTEKPQDIQNVKHGTEKKIEIGDESIILDEENTEEKTTGFVGTEVNGEFSRIQPREKRNENSDTNNGQDYILEKNSKEEPKISNQNPFHGLKNDVMITINSAEESDNLEAIDKKEILQQIVDNVKFSVQNSKNEIRIKLKPETLGEMAMNIEVVKGVITAKIMVDNYRTKEIIEGNLVQFKEQIKDTGLEIKTFEVFVGNNSDFDKQNPNQFNFNKENRRFKLKAQNSKSTINYSNQIELDQDIESKNLDGSLNLLA
ncbi:MAG: flagellar hook-length control protein FliK [Tissierellaceae bacterium]